MDAKPTMRRDGKGSEKKVLMAANKKHRNEEKPQGVEVKNIFIIF